MLDQIKQNKKEKILWMCLLHLKLCITGMFRVLRFEGKSNSTF